MNQAKLMRSKSDRMISGVCGGIAAYLGVDSVFVRLAFLVLIFASGIGLLIYLILMVIMPSEANMDRPSSKVLQDNIEQYGTEFNANVKRVRQHPQGKMIASGLLIVVGVYLLMQNLGWLSWLSGGVFWALVMIGIGVYLLRRNKKNA
jgi:phage shock protein PspC (stress-responsive transcriptional regulator)